MVSLCALVQEYWVTDWPLPLSFERGQVLQVCVTARGSLQIGHRSDCGHVGLRAVIRYIALDLELVKTLALIECIRV